MKFVTADLTPTNKEKKKGQPSMDISHDALITSNKPYKLRRGSSTSETLRRSMSIALLDNEDVEVFEAREEIF